MLLRALCVSHLLPSFGLSKSHLIFMLEKLQSHIEKGEKLKKPIIWKKTKKKKGGEDLGHFAIYFNKYDSITFKKVKSH